MPALPKPRREDRKRANLDTSDLMLAKESPDRDDKYRTFVRGHVCCVWSSQSHCGGATEHAHLQVAGRGLKGSDYIAVPLCEAHHRVGPGAIHRVGIETFQANFQINLWQVAAEIQAAWIRRLTCR